MPDFKNIALPFNFEITFEAVSLYHKLFMVASQLIQFRN
jgi:hypothetical protein